jgi:hypothetical protein
MALFGIDFTPGFNFGVTDRYRLTKAAANSVGSQPSRNGTNPLGARNPGSVVAHKSAPALANPSAPVRRYSAPRPGNTGTNGSYSGYSVVDSQPYYDSYGRAYSSAAQAEAADRAQKAGFINQVFDKKKNMFQIQMDSLNPQEEAGRGNIANQFNSKMNDLNLGLERGKRNLDSSRQVVNEDRSRGLQQLRDQFNQQSMSYNNQIGAMGAGNSSAAQLINIALGSETSKNRGGVMRDASRQLNEIDTRQKDMEVDFENNRKELDNWKNTSLSELAIKFGDMRRQLQSEMANADFERAQQLAQLDVNLTNAALAALGNIENQYRASANSLADQYKNMFAPKDIALKPELQQYLTQKIDPGQIERMAMPEDVQRMQEEALIRKKLEEEKGLI